MKRRSLFLTSVTSFGYALLYVPIISVVIYSFNDSRLVTLWGGFSTALVREPAPRSRSCSTRPFSACASPSSARRFATALGALVALALQRVAGCAGGSC